jgi:hypothetical protein
VTTDPLTFLTATLDAAQRDAEAAAVETGAPGWHGSDSGLYSDDASNHPGPFLADAYGYTAPEVVAHIVRHDPQATLRRIAADRKTLAAYEKARAEYEADGSAWDHESETGRARTAALEFAVRNLAEGWGWTGAAT